jgi:hypothetical protein
MLRARRSTCCSRFPAFNIEITLGQGRGLGQASGNVLLNGARIVTKSASIADDLARIPAGNVSRDRARRRAPR